MSIVRGIAIAGLVAMGIAIGYAFLAGDFGREGAVIGGLPWGIVSLVDLYTGFILFSVWVVYRERSRPIAALWVVLTMVLGNFTVAAYVLWTTYSSGGDPRRFFLGAHA